MRIHVARLPGLLLPSADTRTEKVEILLAATGVSTFVSSTVRHVILSGDVLLLPLGTPYHFERSEKFEYYRVQVSEPVYSEMIRKAGISLSKMPFFNSVPRKSVLDSIVSRIILKVQDIPRFTSLLDQMRLESEQEGFKGPVLQESYFLQLLISMARYILDVGNLQGHRVPKFDKVINHMIQNYSRTIQLKELTETSGLSKSQFLKLFYQEYKTSPISYLCNIRMKEACRLLSQTDIRIMDVGKRVGYQDNNFFTRQFKKTVGLTPNAYRASRQKSNAKRIGFLIGFSKEFFTSGYYMYLMRGVLEGAHQKGYEIELYSRKKPITPMELSDLIRKESLSGMLVADWENVFQKFPMNSLPEIPFVALNSYISHPKISSVVFPNKEAASEVIHYLYSLGHRRIGLITGPDYNENSRSRLEGALQAMQELGLDTSPSLIKVGTFEDGSGYEKTLELLRMKDLPTALFCFNDWMAIGAMKAARELGLKIPKDLSLVGFDNMIESQNLVPPLTTYSQDIPRLGLHAVITLLYRIEKRTPGGNSVFPGELLVRESAIPLVKKA